MFWRASWRVSPLRACSLGAGALCVLGALLIAGCRGETAPAAPAPSTDDVTLPSIDTHDFTPREAHEFSRYVKELPSPCPAVAVPLAQCVLEKRDCASCVPAATLVAKAVHDGMAAEQVHDLYTARFGPGAPKEIPLEGSPSRGPDDAPVTVVEFADFECPFCQRLAPELDAAWEPRKTKVRFVYKFMPLPMHPHGEIAARAGIAAQAQGKFWEMHHELFTHGDRLDPTDLDGYAKTVGLDLARFHDDMQAAATTARIEADHKLADVLGVKGTPTVYIDGREYDVKIALGDWIDGELAGHHRAEP